MYIQSKNIRRFKQSGIKNVLIFSAKACDCHRMLREDKRTTKNRTQQGTLINSKAG